MLMVPKSARAHSIKSRVVPKSAVARERVKRKLGYVGLKTLRVALKGVERQLPEVLIVAQRLSYFKN